MYDGMVSLLMILGVIIVGAFSARLVYMLTGSIALGLIALAVVFVGYVAFLYKVSSRKSGKDVEKADKAARRSGKSAGKTEKSAEKEQETRKDDPYVALEMIDKAEREKYPESIRNIRMADIRKRAIKRRAEIYRSAKSFKDEKELIDIAVKVFSSNDAFVNTPSFVVKAALKLIGYDEEIVDSLYQMLYNENTRVYNILR